MKKLSLLLFTLTAIYTVNGQDYDDRYSSEIDPAYWQQHVAYTMDIDMNVDNYQYSGLQKLEYTNNSPDTLYQVFYHLYPNAFQPGSEMDARVKTLADPDRRMVENIGTKENPEIQSRISTLSEDEIGFIKVEELSQDNVSLKHVVEGTVLEVKLNEPLLPGKKTVFNMKFQGQVPVQIRRSGRNNSEGVALSMTQWYPKLAEYDEDGWHADPYIQREFYGVWGDFDVNITIDKDYVVGGTGYLQNANEIGHGYEDEGVKVDNNSKNKLTWRFHAPNVHDFTWAADPDYLHDKANVPNGPQLHFLYKNDKEILENWKKLQPITVELFQYFNETIGQYPYKQYSVIQGGDGGMEYGMCTLITGNRQFPSLISVTAHEIAHSWFQFLLATNELKYGWMDEGFTSYFSSYAQDRVLEKNLDNPAAASYRGYLRVAMSGKEEPLSTQADHFDYNAAYTVYTKGATFLSQLKYIIGKNNFDKTIKEYYRLWAFKHPDPNDFLRVAEKVSGIQLDWYLNDWLYTLKVIDFMVANVEDGSITIERVGQQAMPLDVKVKYVDGSEEMFYIPLRDMRGEKPTSATILEDWAWAYKTYKIKVDKEVEVVVIDPENMLADINPENNTFTASTD